MNNIKLTYKCKCMREEVTFECASRREGESVTDYMVFVQIAVTADHRTRSPLCISPALDYLKMPIEDNKGIGEVSTRQ